MEFNELVESRRSIRCYAEGGNPDAEAVRQMISCALEAPSWKNSETGRYYVAIDGELRRAVDECLPEFNRNSSKNAAYVVTAFEKGIAGFNTPDQPTNELGNEWGAYDLGLQNAYFCLKARELGYDTLIMGIRDATGLRKVFSIPDSQEVVAVLAVGKRGKEPSKPTRKCVSEVSNL